MTDDRSERLRRRRKQSKGATGTDESRVVGTAPDSSATDGESESGSDSDSADDRSGSDYESVSIKEEQIGTYMYLPESQRKELRRLYNVLKAEYEFEYDDEFEKNRHFYPLVVQFGLDGLDGLEASEIRDSLDELT